MKHNARQWARSQSTAQLEYDVGHCRKLRDCFFISHRYDVYYAVLIGIYRAELRRRTS